MLISVNSIRKSSGTSTFSIALGVLLAQATNFSVLLIDGNYIYSDIDTILGIETDRGIDDVLDLINSNKITEKHFRDIAIELGNFYILSGSKISQYNRFEMEDVNFDRLFSLADSLYDIVIIDSPTPKMLNYLNKSGRTKSQYLNVIITRQNFLIFEKYVRSKEYNADNSVIVINRYLDSRKFNKAFIANAYKIKVPIYTLRNSEKLVEAFNDRMIDRYLLNENDGFLQDTNIFINYLADTFKFDLHEQYSLKKSQYNPQKKKGLFW
jgi:MinD-like ATPase involved in chromosome partitioning or flagellar assembly